MFARVQYYQKATVIISYIWKYWPLKFFWREIGQKKCKFHYFKNYIFAVPETRDWLFVSSPYPQLLITFGYLYFVLYAGPRYMKDRPPFELRSIILIYDMIQILANSWVVKEHLSAGWFSDFTLICRSRYSTSLNAMKVCFYNIIIILKIVNVNYNACIKE